MWFEELRGSCFECRESQSRATRSVPGHIRCQPRCRAGPDRPSVIRPWTAISGWPKRLRLCLQGLTAGPRRERREREEWLRRREKRMRFYSFGTPRFHWARVVQGGTIVVESSARDCRFWRLASYLEHVGRIRVEVADCGRITGKPEVTRDRPVSGIKKPRALRPGSV